MKSTLTFAALAAVAAARVSIMLPLYAAPGGVNPSAYWNATFAAIEKHKNLFFYVVINPCDGPTKDGCGRKFEAGYNEDWTTNVARLNQYPNAQPIGYVSTNYNTGGLDRTEANIKKDIDDWAKWKSGKVWAGVPATDSTIYGIWYDETSAKEADYDFYQRLTTYTDTAFAGRSKYTKVMNVGVNMTVDYERRLFGLTDVVVTRETCWQEPSTANKEVCPTPYTPYDAAKLVPGDGLPNNLDLTPKASVIVHYVQAPRDVNADILEQQIRATIQKGIHSVYFTSDPLWNSTLTEPATVGRVADVVDAAQP